MPDMQEKIYIADDDTNIREAIKVFLESEGYRVAAFENGDALLARFREEPCNLSILDVMMPGSDGFSICKQIRAISTVPIIILTARDSELDYATGINLGSDDYFTKPFSPLSLVMRVKAIFRRIEFERKNANDHDFKVLSFGNIIVDEKTKTVSAAGESVSLTPNEYSLLHYLMERPDQAESRDAILEQIRGVQTEIQTRASDDTVLRLRKKIDQGNVAIESVWGYGFRLKVRDQSE